MSTQFKIRIKKKPPIIDRWLLYKVVSNYPNESGRKKRERVQGPYSFTSFLACRHPFRPFRLQHYFLQADLQSHIQ